MCGVSPLYALSTSLSLLWASAPARAAVPQGIPVRFVLPGEGMEQAGAHVAATHAVGLLSLGPWVCVLGMIVLGWTLLLAADGGRRPLDPSLEAVARGGARRLERLLLGVCLWSPLLFMLALVQTDPRPLALLCLIPSVLGLRRARQYMASRRALGRLLRAEPPQEAPEGALLVVTVWPERLGPAEGALPHTPWHCGELRGRSAPADASGDRNRAGEPLRVALRGGLADPEARLLLTMLAHGQSPHRPLLVAGPVRRVPADASAAAPLDRGIPIELCVGGRAGVPVVFGRSRDEVIRQLGREVLLIAGAVACSLVAATVSVRLMSTSLAPHPHPGSTRPPCTGSAS
jgi:hypothetical protein